MSRTYWKNRRGEYSPRFSSKKPSYMDKFYRRKKVIKPLRREKNKICKMMVCSNDMQNFTYDRYEKYLYKRYCFINYW